MSKDASRIQNERGLFVLQGSPMHFNCVLLKIKIIEEHMIV